MNEKKRIKKNMKRIKILHEFIDWHNELHPEHYIPNSRIGRYLLEKQNEK
jgi:hypothetical protein